MFPDTGFFTFTILSHSSLHWYYDFPNVAKIRVILDKKIIGLVSDPESPNKHGTYQDPSTGKNQKKNKQKLNKLNRRGIYQYPSTVT